MRVVARALVREWLHRATAQACLFRQTEIKQEARIVVRTSLRLFTLLAILSRALDATVDDHGCGAESRPQASALVVAISLIESCDNFMH